MNAGARSAGLSFIVGGIVGAGVALLYAPQSGLDTRALLRRKTRESAQALSDLKRRALLEGERLKDQAASLGNALRAGIAEELESAEREVATLTSGTESPRAGA